MLVHGRPHPPDTTVKDWCGLPASSYSHCTVLHAALHTGGGLEYLYIPSRRELPGMEVTFGYRQNGIKTKIMNKWIDKIAVDYSRFTLGGNAYQQLKVYVLLFLTSTFQSPRS